MVELLASFDDDLRYVWRHLPLNDVHPNAQIAAEASEAAAAQGHFWEMHDTLLDTRATCASHITPSTPRTSGSTLIAWSPSCTIASTQLA